MSLAWLLRMLRREWRGAPMRMLLFGACIAVGVSAVVSVEALAEGLESGIRMRSRELLGGDLALESRRPLPDVSAALPARYRGLPHLDVRVLTSMVRVPNGASRLAELKAVDAARYPLAGRLVLEPDQPLASLLDDQAVLVAPELRDQLGLARGDTLLVGGQPLRVAGVVRAEPDPLTFSLSVGPRVLLTRKALERTALLAQGHRVRYRRLYAFPRGTREAELLAVKRQLERDVPGAGTFISIETHADAQPALRRALDQTRQYLGLVTLLSLLIASVGVAQIVSTWLSQATPQIAILRCLGMRSREVAALHLTQLAVWSVVASVVGCVIGALGPWLLGRVYPDLVPGVTLSGLPLSAVLRGLALGPGVALLFSLPPLASVWRVSPALVLRSEASPLPIPRTVRVLAASLAALSLCAAAYAQSSDLFTALAFSAGVATLAFLLALSAHGLLHAVGRLPRDRVPALVWQGASALTRPGAGAVGSVMTLGLGTLVVVAIALLEGLLGQELATALPDDAPSLFLADVQPDQWPGVEALCRDAGAQKLDSVPVVMARLDAIDGRSVRDLLAERPGDPNEKNRLQWVLTREQRITSRKTLTPDNRVVAGALWSDPTRFELSAEEGFARDLGATLGSTITLDVQGVPVDFALTSLRSVAWRSFALNFFLMAEPGALDDAPHFRVAAARFPATAEQGLQNRVAARYPNVSVLRVRDFLERASGLLAQVALAVRLLGGFALLTGLIILVATVASNQLRRAREVALLKTLGVAPRRIVAMFAIEYALGGLVAGGIGVAGAFALAMGFARGVLALTRWPSLTTCALALLGTVALSVLAGLVASVRALRVRPLEVLRRQES